MCWNCKTPKDGSTLEDNPIQTNDISEPRHIDASILGTTTEITAVRPANWVTIQFAFLTRLFGYGGIGSLTLGLLITGIAIISRKDSSAGVAWSLAVVALALFLASAPRLGVLTPPILLLVGILDGVLGLLLRLVSIPLVLFSGLGLVTNLIGIRLGNAGQWIRAHGTVIWAT